MSYSDQDKFFAQAYRTGTDHWSTIPFAQRAHDLAIYLPKDALVLDLGPGRGRMLFDLANVGFRAIGLENNNELVHHGNAEVKAKGLEKHIRFMHGSALDIPLADESFDAVIDVGLLQHILPVDYPTYISEVLRVLKHGGYCYLTVLSKHTPNYLAWHPSRAEISDYQLEGVNYHFFDDEEIRLMFEQHFIVEHVNHDMPHGPMETVFAVALMKKK